MSIYATPSSTSTARTCGRRRDATRLLPCDVPLPPTATDTAVRWHKVEQARRRLARGDYDQPTAIDEAVEKMLDRLR